MNGKAILIVVDGMRADAPAAAGHPFADAFIARSRRSLKARSVAPSITLPCLVSMFFSASPEEHGITGNRHVPLPAEMQGLFEQVAAGGGESGFFYDWEELRDLSRPGSLARACFISGDARGWPLADELVTGAAIDFIVGQAPRFVFLYLGQADVAGHESGYLGGPYLDAVRRSWDCIERVSRVAADYSVLVTSDHGGHDRSHGTGKDEDMLVPVFIRGPGIEPGPVPGETSILDIAPTLAALAGCPAYPGWSGRSLV